MLRTDSRPWQWPDRDALPTLFGGLLAPKGVDRTTALPVVRAAVDMVMGWVGVELTWSTLVDVVEDGVGNPHADSQRAGVDWEFASGKPGRVRWVYLEAVPTQLAEAFGHPNRRVAQVSARFPTFSTAQGRDVGRMTVGVSVQRWALYGSGEDLPWFAPTLDRWMVESATVLGAETGFALLDGVQASDLESPWERRARAYAEPGTEVWGYGWGTLLAPAQLDRVGGVERLSQLPDVRVQNLTSGRVWLTLGDNPATVPDEQMQTLHDVLAPALPAVHAAEHVVPDAAPSAPPNLAQLRASWQKQADEALADGRRSGRFGSVGFSVLLLDLFAPVATDVLPDTVVFAGLGDEQAMVLLAVLSGELLDVQIGAGPTLRGVFQAMVEHPGQIIASGLLFGPSRDDEGLMVDQVQVHGDPVLAALQPDDIDAAYQRLVALGIEAASEPDEAVRAPDGAAWAFWWD